MSELDCGVGGDRPLVSYHDWHAVEERRRDVIGSAAVANLHDLLDRPGTAPTDLPILWHWLGFTPRARQSQIGSDGHPRTGSFLPPMAGKRRMFAGGRVIRRGTISVDEPLERVSRVVGIKEKRGRSGRMVFVEVEHLVTGPLGRIEQTDSIVYREPTGQPSVHPAGPTREDPAREGATDEDATQWDWRRSLSIDPTVLFRFSALTYNAHRIHYDRDYARGVEGYPGLVVHGPLQALLLADLATRRLPRVRITSFTFRSTSPAFDTNPFEVCGAARGSSIELAALSSRAITMRATAGTEEMS